MPTVDEVGSSSPNPTSKATVLSCSLGEQSPTKQSKEFSSSHTTYPRPSSRGSEKSFSLRPPKPHISWQHPNSSCVLLYQQHTNNSPASVNNNNEHHNTPCSSISDKKSPHQNQLKISRLSPPQSTPCCVVSSPAPTSWTCPCSLPPGTSRAVGAAWTG